ncbi:restriction endonuclease subunit S [Pontibacter litorisediminis]|uniref:restriction endonuclease subunit S n=1 Tax=Pontibacter litorisediminis TaxID=1846260 RepID=UPI0023EC948D|nr:restriction endonuclease subunit S [Pontibacter litorisediminis]
MMKKYDSYKNSGVEWLGEVPEHWELKKLKYVANINPSKADVLAGVDDEQPVTFLPMEKVSENGTIDTEIKKPIKELVSGFTFFQKCDVIVAKITPCFENGKGAYLEKLDSPFGFGSTEFHVLRGHEEVVLNEFLYYVTKSNLFMELGEGAMTGAGGQKRVPTPFLQDYLLAYPSSLTEQKAIVDFVKSKTSQIDSLIQKKQQMIALLEEEKTAVINEAVTKGLAPDAPMEDSGVAWLGKVPAYWEVKKLKYLASLKSGDSITSDSIDREVGEYPVYGGNGRRGYTASYTHEGFYILIGRQGALCGNINYAQGQFWASEHAVVVSILGQHDTIWLGELLRAMNLNQYSQSAAQPGLAVDNIQNLYVPVPPYSEQLEISSYIQGELGRINTTITHVMREITLLQEYRTALISEAVTGKIDVRDYQPEPITSTALA